jgi:hypothetical protein
MLMKSFVQQMTAKKSNGGYTTHSTKALLQITYTSADARHINPTKHMCNDEHAKEGLVAPACLSDKEHFSHNQEQVIST